MTDSVIEIPINGSTEKPFKIQIIKVNSSYENRTSYIQEEKPDEISRVQPFFNETIKEWKLFPNKRSK